MVGRFTSTVRVLLSINLDSYICRVCVSSSNLLNDQGNIVDFVEFSPYVQDKPRAASFIVAHNIPNDDDEDESTSSSSEEETNDGHPVQFD